MTHTYGAASSVLVPGGIAGWHLVDNTPSQSFDKAGASKDIHGHYIPASLKAVGKKTTLSEIWEPDGDASVAPTLTLGRRSGKTSLDTATLTCSSSSRPRLALGGHRHDDGVALADHEAGSAVVTFEFPEGAYGAVNPFGNVSLNGISDYQIQSSAQTASMDHLDEPDISGQFLVGISRGLKRTASLSATTDAEPSIGMTGGWLIRMRSLPSNNSQFRKISMEGEMYVDESVVET